MGKRKQLDIAKLLSVDDSKLKRRTRKPDKCEECKAPLIASRGYGYCEHCMLTTPLPVARILNAGPHRGKFVYLKSAIIRELQEDNDLPDVKAALEEELHTKEYFIIDEIKED